MRVGCLPWLCGGGPQPYPFLLLATYYQRIKRRDQAAAQLLDVSKLAKYCVDAPSAVPAVASQLVDRIGRDCAGGIRRAGHVRLALKLCKEVIEALYNGNTAEIGTISIFEDCCLQSSNYALRSSGLDGSLHLVAIDLAVGVLSRRSGRVADWAGITDTTPLEALFEPILNVLYSSSSSPPSSHGTLCLTCISALVLLVRSLPAPAANTLALGCTHRLLGIMRHSMSVGASISTSTELSRACALLLREFCRRLYLSSTSSSTGTGRIIGQQGGGGTSGSLETLHASVWAFMDAYAWRPAPFARAVVAAIDGTIPVPGDTALPVPTWAGATNSGAQPGANMRPLQGSARGLTAMYTPGLSLASPLGSSSFVHGAGGGGGGGEAPGGLGLGSATLATCGAPFLTHSHGNVSSMADSALVQVSLLTHLALIEHAFEASIGEPLSTAGTLQQDQGRTLTAASLTRQLSEMLVVPWTNSATYAPALYGSLPSAPEVPWWLARVEVQAGGGPTVLQGFQSMPTGLQPTAIYTALAELCVLREGMLGALLSTVTPVPPPSPLPTLVTSSVVEECLFILAELAACCPDGASTGEASKGKGGAELAFPSDLATVLSRGRECASAVVTRLHASGTSLQAQVRMVSQVAGAYAQMWCLVHTAAAAEGTSSGSGVAAPTGPAGAGSLAGLTTPPRPHHLSVRATSSAPVSHPILLGSTGRRPSIAAGGSVTPIRPAISSVGGHTPTPTLIPAPLPLAPSVGLSTMSSLPLGATAGAVGSHGLHKARVAFLQLILGLLHATTAIHGPAIAEAPGQGQGQGPGSNRQSYRAGTFHLPPELTVPLEMALYDRHIACSALAVEIWSDILLQPPVCSGLAEVPVYPRLWAVVAQLWAGSATHVQLGSRLALAMVQVAPVPALLALFPCTAQVGPWVHLEEQCRHGITAVMRKVQERLHRAQRSIATVSETPRFLDSLPIPFEAMCDVLLHPSLGPTWQALGYTSSMERDKAGRGRVRTDEVDLTSALPALHAAVYGMSVAGPHTAGVWLDLRASTVIPLLPPTTPSPTTGSDSDAAAPVRTDDTGGVEAAAPESPPAAAPASWGTIIRALAHTLLTPRPPSFSMTAPPTDLCILATDSDGLSVINANAAVHALPLSEVSMLINAASVGGGKPADSGGGLPTDTSVPGIRALKGPYILPSPRHASAGRTAAGATGSLGLLGLLGSSTRQDPGFGSGAAALSGGLEAATTSGAGIATGHGAAQRRLSQQGGRTPADKLGVGAGSISGTPASASASVAGTGTGEEGVTDTFDEPVISLSLELSADSSAALGLEGESRKTDAGSGSGAHEHAGAAPGGIGPGPAGPLAAVSILQVRGGAKEESWEGQAQQALAVLSRMPAQDRASGGPVPALKASGLGTSTGSPLTRLQADPTSWLAIAQP